MKRKLLKLTGIGEVLTKEAQDKLDSAQNTLVFEDLTCSNGYKREWYESMNIPIPDDLKEKEKEFELGVELEDEDYEILEYPCRIFQDEIVGYVHSKDDTIIFTKTGLTFTVKDKVEEIDQQIENN